MENVFTDIGKISKTGIIRLDKDIIVKLKALNKGSMNNTVRLLLGEKDGRIDSRIKQTEQDIAELQEKLERLVMANKLR